MPKITRNLQLRLSVQKLKRMGVLVKQNDGQFEIGMRNGRTYRPSEKELIIFEEKLSAKKNIL